VAFVLGISWTQRHSLRKGDLREEVIFKGLFKFLDFGRSCARFF
jgi:hypothetical protein